MIEKKQEEREAYVSPLTQITKIAIEQHLLVSSPFEGNAGSSDDDEEPEPNGAENNHSF